MQEESYDFIIVGSGGGSVPAALVMKDAGRHALILEKQALIGGSSSYSGGMLWIPNNHYMKAAGFSDSPEDARAYMDAVIGEPTRASTSVKRDAYIKHAPEMIEFLARRGLKYRYADLPDYYDEMPGGMAHGRSIVPRVFDLSKLGDWAPLLGGHPMTRTYPTEGAEAQEIFRGGLNGNLIKLKVGWRIVLNKLFGRKIRGFGNALMGQLFFMAKKAGIPIWTETTVRDILVENGRVVGVIAERQGRDIRLRAELGVLLNAGGFSRNREMREQYQPKPATSQWSQMSPGDTGEMIQKATDIGAAIELMDEAFWFPCSFMPDGTLVAMHAVYDLGKPGTILVGPDGHRFVNEAISHMEVGRQMYAARAIPAWAVFDETRRSKYPFGVPMGGLGVEGLVKSGYLKRADSLEELAAQCGVDPTGLKDTVARVNGFASTGIDLDFHRGESVYQQSGGDPRVKPNPTLCAGVIATIIRLRYQTRLRVVSHGTTSGLMFGLKIVSAA